VRDALQIKHSTWFAAGPEIDRALTLLSDGAFKLYCFLCLHANRRTGSISISYSNAAAALGKSRRSINTYFEELRERGVCIVSPAMNQHQASIIEINDEFWPYTRCVVDPPRESEASYLKNINSLLRAHDCVKCSFSAADENLAKALYARGVLLQIVERAIALGCSRKYVSLLNGTGKGFISSLSYFSDLIEEASDTETPVGYWDYLITQLRKLESLWIKRREATNAIAAALRVPDK
jgi:hypothetical protein